MASPLVFDCGEIVLTLMGRVNAVDGLRLGLVFSRSTDISNII